MPCYHPLSAWQLLNVKTANGKPTISFKNPYARPNKNRVGIQVPCGQCIGCRLDRSRQWAIRCVHEAYGHEDNAFITLTYAPEHLPKDGSLPKYKGGHFELFLKRLRKRISPILIRFFSCGEYGEKNSRPHYHACIFGYGFPDKYQYTVRDGIPLYRSPLLEEVWGLGFATVGSVTFESAAYVARYITKKITGENAEGYYDGKKPEYTTMSRKPGIGKHWYDEFKTDVYPSDQLILRGKELRPPRYYDKQFELDNPEDLFKIKAKRKAKALEAAVDNTTARLIAKETCKRSQFQQLKRGLENET
ncbi:MAG: replication initiator protein [Arizlama microvirus]|nr:MAG: replication initiator protein [Arizlama microvirus]